MLFNEENPMLDKMKWLFKSGLTSLFNRNGKKYSVSLQNHNESNTFIEMSDFIYPSEERGLKNEEFFPSLLNVKRISCDYEAIHSISMSINTFAWELYAHLKEEAGNLFFSPYAISSALAMTYAGVRENTEKQMAKVLHFNQNVHQAFLEFDNYLTYTNNSYKFQIVNALWGQKEISLLIEFINLTHNYYHTVPKPVDFVNDTENSRQIINQWTQENTDNQIKEVLPAGSVVPQTKLVLTNSVYFKGNWLFPFDENKTQEQSFRVARNHQIMVPMMVIEEMFRYVELPYPGNSPAKKAEGSLEESVSYKEVEKVQLVVLPYYRESSEEKESLSMVIILPREADDFEKIESKLISSLDKWLQAGRVENVRVYLPKLKMESSFNLNHSLEKLGMHDVFQQKEANFFGMTAEEDLSLSVVMHKVFVEIDESGIQLGVTNLELDLGIDESVKEFRADHPFILVIRDNLSGTILFLGRVMNPLDF